MVSGCFTVKQSTTKHSILTSSYGRTHVLMARLGTGADASIINANISDMSILWSVMKINLRGQWGQASVHTCISFNPLKFLGCFTWKWICSLAKSRIFKMSLSCFLLHVHIKPTQVFAVMLPPLYLMTPGQIKSKLQPQASGWHLIIVKEITALSTNTPPTPRVRDEQQQTPRLDCKFWNNPSLQVLKFARVHGPASVWLLNQLPQHGGTGGLLCTVVVMNSNHRRYFKGT